MPAPGNPTPPALEVTYLAALEVWEHCRRVGVHVDQAVVDVIISSFVDAEPDPT